MEDNIQWKPCPFCGSKKVSFSSFPYANPPRGFVSCRNCGARGPGKQFGSSSLEFPDLDAWNNRAEEDALLGMVKELEELIVEANAAYTTNHTVEPIEVAKLGLVAMCYHGADALVKLSELESK